jgi:uncharacterized membrane protein
VTTSEQRTSASPGPPEASRQPRRWLLAPAGVTVLAFAAGFWQKLPCQAAGWPDDTATLFGRYCYSDVPILFRERGLIDGVFPYAPAPGAQALEYPVLTGYLMDATARLVRAVLPGADVAVASRAYFLTTVLVLLALAVLTVWATVAALRRTGGRPGDAVLVAAAPVLILAGTVNWDLLAVAAAVLAVLAWARDRPLVTGVLIGVGTAAKLFPLLLLLPLFLLCLRRREMGPFTRAAAGAAGAWVLLNLPVLLAHPDGWMEFWRFNAGRGAEFGSLWYALEGFGLSVPAVNAVALAVFGALLAGTAALTLRARRPLDLAQLACLVVGAFLLTNKVYSPQYALWLLPLVVIARGRVRRPRVLRDWAVWQAAEVVYWLAVWSWLAGSLPDERYYAWATVLRVLATAYLCAQVARDALTDPVRPG